jgi:hypothetical protein
VIPEPTPQALADTAQHAADTLARRGQTEEWMVSQLMADRYKQLADKEK